MAKENLENVARDLIQVENRYSYQLENRIGSTLQSNIAENRRFKTEEESVTWYQFEGHVTKKSTLQNYKTILNEHRISHYSESEKKFNQGSNVNKYLQNHLSDNHPECSKGEEALSQRSRI